MRLGRAGVVIVESVKSVRLPVLVLAILAAWVLIHGILRDGGLGHGGSGSMKRRVVAVPACCVRAGPLAPQQSAAGRHRN